MNGIRRTIAGLALAGALAAATFPADGKTTAHTFVSSGFTLGYRTIGHGTPIIYVAGGPGFTANYLDPIAQGLPGTMGVMLDPRGVGASSDVPMSAQTLSVDSLVNDIDNLRVALGAPRIVLLGHSLGGFLAMAYTHKFPTNVAALILVDSTPPDLQLDSRLGGQLAKRMTPQEQNEYMALTAKMDTNPAEAMRQQTEIVLPATFADRAKAKAMRPYLTSRYYDPTMIHWLGRDLTSHYRIPEMHDFSAPVFIIAGEEDAGESQIIAALRIEFPDPKIVIIPHAGHYPWFEQPGPFFHALRSFIAQEHIAATPRH